MSRQVLLNKFQESQLLVSNEEQKPVTHRNVIAWDLSHLSFSSLESRNLKHSNKRVLSACHSLPVFANKICPEACLHTAFLTFVTLIWIIVASNPFLITLKAANSACKLVLNKHTNRNSVINSFRQQQRQALVIHDICPVSSESIKFNCSSGS